MSGKAPQKGKKKQEQMFLDEYIARCAYVIMRQCPNAPRVLGVSDFWHLRADQVTQIIEFINEEYKTD